MMKFLLRARCVFVLTGVAWLTGTGASAWAATACDSQRYHWEMDKNDQQRADALATCEKLDSAIQQAKAARAKMPEAKIGMTQKQVTDGTRWGPPVTVNKITDASGTREEWVYGGGWYLNFKNGRLASIQTRE